MPVLDEGTGESIGTISGILINPDTGVVEGFFVRTSSAREDLLLSRLDILHWGLRLSVRSADVLAPLEDLIRLQSLVASDRPVIGQMMRTESGRALGRCVDVQFSTKDFRLEWLFPRKFFRSRDPVPVSQILEVRPDAIVLRDTVVPATDVADPLAVIAPMPEVA